MSRPPPAKRNNPAEQFRAEIAKAEADGVSRDDMTLHLTLGDVNKLTRDRSLAIDDISFVGGTMRYLGVKVERGGLAISRLLLPDDA